jgi:hypothetical protein
MTAQDTGKFRSNLTDKFYTRPEVAATCLQQLLPLVPPTALWLEPAAGAGAFVTALQSSRPSATWVARDLEPPPSAPPNTQKGDFLAMTRADLGPVAAGRPLVVFGNPPFGRQATLARRFVGHAAALGADWIAFILPRSFQKPSLQRAFPLEYRLQKEIALAPNAFLVNGVAYDVPCVFQIWARGVGARAVEAPAQPAGFQYVKAGEAYDIAVRRVGGLAGRAFEAAAGRQFAVQSHYFVKLDRPEAAAQICSVLCAHEFPSNTTGPRSLSKGEVTPILNAAAAAAAAQT